MTDKTNPPTGEGGASKRPHATLDLKATEVTREAAQGSEGSGVQAVKTTPSGETSGATSVRDAAKTGGKPEASGPGSGAGPSKSPATDDAPIRNLAGTLSHLAAAVVGGAVVLFGGEWASETLQRAGFTSPASSLAEQAKALDQRLRAVEANEPARSVDAEVAAKFAAQDEKLAKVEGLNAELQLLKDQQAKLASDTDALAKKANEPVLDAATAERLGKLESELGLIAKAADSETDGGRIAQIAALAGRIADLESNVATEISALRLSIPQNVDQRIEVIGSQAETAKSGQQRADREQAQLKTEIARLGQTIETLKADNERLQKSVLAAQEETGRVASDLGAIKGVVDQQSKTFAKPADVAAATATLNGKLQEIEKSVATVMTREENRQTNAERIVMSLELANLRRAIDRGDSYARELDAAKAAAQNRLDLTALEAFKSEGTPSLVALQERRRAVFNAMLDANEIPADGSVVDQLLASAKSVVRVRKTSVEAGDTGPEATIARAESLLMTGKLDECLALLKSLPAPMQTAGGTWLKHIEARHAIDKAISDIEGQLKTALVAPPAGGEAPPSQPAMDEKK
ncbi:MAG: hypothetical protein NW216_10625 [Hyphomicrobium sp.]|nr:hypothetical protein [Hyphomicrobium sp.]